MSFEDLLEWMREGYVLCDSLQQQTELLAYLRDHGVRGDSVLEDDVHNGNDVWCLIGGCYDGLVHGRGKPWLDETAYIRFSNIASGNIAEIAAYDLGSLDELLA